MEAIDPTLPTPIDVRDERPAVDLSRRRLLFGAAAGVLAAPLLRGSAAALGTSDGDLIREPASSPISGSLAAPLQARARSIPAQLHRARRGGRRRVGDLGRTPGRRSVGRDGPRRHEHAVARRHARARMVVHEGRDRSVCAHPRTPRSARSRRTRHRLLARVRTEREGVDDRRDAALAPGGRPGAARPAAGRRVLRPRVHDRPARRRGAVLDPGYAPRLSRAHVRLPGRRAGPAHHGPDARRVLPRGGRRPARDRLLDGPPRQRGRPSRIGAPGSSARSAVPELPDRSAHRPDLDPGAGPVQQRRLPEPGRGRERRGARGHRDRCVGRVHERARARAPVPGARRSAHGAAARGPRRPRAHVAHALRGLRRVRHDPLALRARLREVDRQPARNTWQPGQRDPVRRRLPPLGLRRIDRIRGPAREPGVRLRDEPAGSGDAVQFTRSEPRRRGVPLDRLFGVRRQLRP